ncbi:MAG: cysteine hydrolase [Nitrososphaerota archaeon]|nr:cysteine hydrolase [Nitrososphaerota archaeon]MDG6922658.1 cysteine hydrolase [Nitrososphaerota archaeon]
MPKPLPQLKPNETALLIIDMQNDFCRQDGYFGRVRGRDMKNVMHIIPKIAELLDFTRRNGITSIFIKTIHSKHTDSEVWTSRLVDDSGILLNQTNRHPADALCALGSTGAEIVDELQPNLDEPVVIKHRYSSFVQTDLELMLRIKGIKNVLVTGNATNVCVESTARHAFMLDFLTVTVSDCVATSDSHGVHESSLLNLEGYFGYVAPSDKVLKALGVANLAVDAHRVSRS